MYSLAFPEDEDARIAQALCSGWDYPGWGGGSFLSRGPVSARCRKQYEVEDSDVISVIDGVRYIICGAYDGMGYVVWRSAASSETSV